MGRKASLIRTKESESRRSDYGHLKRKERDWGAMELIGSMRVMRFDTLGEYWAPDHSVAIALPDQQKSEEQKQEEKTGPGRGGKRTGEPWPPDWQHRSMAVARIVYKLEEHGLVKRWQAWDGQPQWVALTEEGYRYRRLPWHELDWPDPDDLNHDGRYYISHTHRVNQMRLRLLAGAAGVPKHIWISERAIEAGFPPKESGISLPQLPDGVMLLQEDGKWDITIQGEVVDTVEMKKDQRIAVEFELSRKSYPRLEGRVLPSLLEQYDFVWYFADEDARKAVYKARDQHVPNEDDQRRIRIMKLSEYLS
jgi:hypothetical protein